VAGLLLQAQDLYQSGGGEGAAGLAALDPVITACRRKDLEINGQARLPVLPAAGGGSEGGTGRVDSEKEEVLEGSQVDLSVLSSVASPRSPHSPTRRRGDVSLSSGRQSASVSPLRSSSTFSKGLKLPAISSSVRPILSHVAEYVESALRFHAHALARSGALKLGVGTCGSLRQFSHAVAMETDAALSDR